MITDFTNPERKKWLEITKRPELDHKKIKPLVKKIFKDVNKNGDKSLYKYTKDCLLYTSPSPRDISGSRMQSSA